jgi:hypothetical protein
MVLVDTNKMQVSMRLKVRCKTCKKRIAAVWPDKLCTNCYINVLKETNKKKEEEDAKARWIGSLR